MAGFAAAVQLRGKEQVLGAYQNSEIDVWAIYQGKNLLVKGSDAGMLEQFLDLLCKNGSTAIYTLKMYEDVTDPKTVKEKTEASGSLNFRLEENDFEKAGGEAYQGRNNYLVNRLENRLSAIESKIGGVGEAEEPQTFEQAAIGLLADPVGLVQVITAIKELLRPNGANQQQPAADYSRGHAIGNIQKSETVMEENTNEALLKRLQAAVTILEENDPELVNHLEKLAIISQDKPGQFKILVSMLDKM